MNDNFVEAGRFAVAEILVAEVLLSGICEILTPFPRRKCLSTTISGDAGRLTDLILDGVEDCPDL